MSVSDNDFLGASALLLSQSLEQAELGYRYLRWLSISQHVLSAASNQLQSNFSEDAVSTFEGLYKTSSVALLMTQAEQIFEQSIGSNQEAHDSLLHIVERQFVEGEPAKESLRFLQHTTPRTPLNEQRAQRLAARSHIINNDLGRGLGSSQ